MGDIVDLTGDGGVLKKIVRRAKSDAIAPSEGLPLVDGMFYIETFICVDRCLFQSQDNNLFIGSETYNPTDCLFCYLH